MVVYFTVTLVSLKTDFYIFLLFQSKSCFMILSDRLIGPNDLYEPLFVAGRMQGRVYGGGGRPPVTVKKNVTKVSGDAILST